MKTGWFVVLAASFYLFVVAVFWPMEKKIIVPATSQPHIDAAGYGHGVVNFSDVSVNVEIPMTATTQERGLGGRNNLADNQGMYWRYEVAGRPMFWMKGMLISLDFVWITEGRVSQLTQNIPAPADPMSPDLAIYQPDVPVDGVLEVPAGFTARRHISVGDPVSLTQD